MMKQIEDVLNIPSSEISSKLHSLRTQFNRECSRVKTQKSGSGSDDAYTSKWEYFSSLQFLKVSTMPGETISNLVMLTCEKKVDRKMYGFFMK